MEIGQSCCLADGVRGAGRVGWRWGSPVAWRMVSAAQGGEPGGLNISCDYNCIYQCYAALSVSLSWNGGRRGERGGRRPAGDIRGAVPGAVGAGCWLDDGHGFRRR